MESGIYKITDKRNNKIYIGRAINLNNRKWRHFCYCSPEKYSENSLKNEANMLIHKAMLDSKKKEDFDFEVLEYCDADKLDEREQYYISTLNSKTPYGYNSTDGGCTYPHLKGEQHSNSILKQYQVDLIYQMLLDGNTVAEIQQFVPEATMETISAINTGRNWRKEGYVYPISRLNGVIKVSDQQVQEIRDMWKQGKSISEILCHYPNIARTTITDILSGRTHKNIPIDYVFKTHKKHIFTEEEVNFYRQMYFLDKKTFDEVYSYYSSIEKENVVSESSFRDMIKGRSYKQYKVYIEEKKPYEETQRGKEQIRREEKNNRNNYIKELNKQGVNKIEIAKKAGCSVRTVYRVLGAK